MTARRVASERGFTLVELLIVLALMAVLSALLVGGLRVTRGALSRSEAASEELDRVSRAFAVIRREIERADPLLVAPLTETPQVAFWGSASSIVFIAPPPTYASLGGDQITWLVIERAAGANRLVLRYRPLDRASDLWPPEVGSAQSVVLLDGLGGAELAYYGRTDPQSQPQWFAAWPDASALPLLVRLRVAGWPDLVIEPRLGKTAATGFLGSMPACGRGLRRGACP